MIYKISINSWSGYLIIIFRISAWTSPDAIFSPFEQEEITEWWSNTSEAGAEIPSEEYLIEKFKKKEMLGL